MAFRVIICDDEAAIRASLREYLEKHGYEILEASSGESILELINKSTPDALILDLNLPKLGGMEVLKKLDEHGIHIPTMVVTGFGAIDTAIEATQLGAKAYVQKPFDLRDVEFQLQKMVHEASLAFQVHHLKREQSKGHGQLIGSSDAIKRVFDMIEQITHVDIPTILITGESGTGKDLVAQTIHANGQRKDGLFLVIDCAALAEPLVESELFGYEKGAFTDAKQMKRGLLELAQKGTIFLDEIGDISLGTQAKLLRALETKHFKRVGGLLDHTFDAALIAATNQNLPERVKNHLFREDLFFRLNVIPIHLPPLRERTADIPLLIEHFIERCNEQLNRHVTGISSAALLLCQQYNWPGNIRELRNVIERIMILGAPNNTIEVNSLPAEIQISSRSPTTLPQEGIKLKNVEEDLIKQALDRCNGNQSQAARLLGISRYALRYRLDKSNKNRSSQV